MKESFKKGAQKYLESKNLSSQQLYHLQMMQKEYEEKNHSRHFFSYKMISVVPVLMLFLFSFYLINLSRFSAETIEQRIAEEVAANHLKLKPLEIKANTIQDISPYFTQLNFSPVEPLVFQLSKQNLLGARYCSIQGVTALQLRMMNHKTKKVLTLYETDYDKQVFKGFPIEKPVSYYVKGLKIDMWVEKDILFALIE